MSIIRRFSCVVPRLTRHLYSDLEFVQRISGRSIPSTLSIVDLTKALMSNLWAILYSSKAKTLLVTLLHLIED